MGGWGSASQLESRPPHTRWLLRLLLRVTLHPQGSTRPPAAHPPRDQPPPSYSCIHQWVHRHAQDAQGPRAGLWAPEDGAGCGLTSPAQTGDKGWRAEQGPCLSASLRPTSPPGLPPEQAGKAHPASFSALIAQASHPPGGHSRWGLGGRLALSSPDPLSWGRRACRDTGWGDGGAAPAPAHTLRLPTGGEK